MDTAMTVVFGILLIGSMVWVVWESEQIIQDRRERRNRK